MQLPSKSASLTRITLYLKQTYSMASQCEEYIVLAANEHLKPAIAEIEAATAAATAAAAAEADARAAVILARRNCEVRIGGVSDEMWTEQKRPVRSRQLAQVFPGGIVTYKAPEFRRDPTLLGMLESRILSTEAPEWSEDQRKAWAGKIATVRAASEEAVKKHAPLAATSRIARATVRTAVGEARDALMAFKRALQTLGLSPRRIAEIMPDATPAPAGAKPATPEPGTPAPTPTTAPKAGG